MSRWDHLAGFCRFWRISPAEALAMPVTMVESFARYQHREFLEQKRQAAKLAHRRR